MLWINGGMDMKSWKAIGSILLAAVAVLSFTSCRTKDTMGAPQPAPANLSTPQQKAREMKNGDIFVSPNGDDKNSGTRNAPVKTVERALALAKALDKEEKVILLADGEYHISAVTLTREDNGVTFFAENNAVLNGGITLNPSDFTDYDQHIKMLDLKKYGITKEAVGNVRAFGQYNTAEKYNASGSLYCELFCDDKRMTPARYPNDGEEPLKTGKITDNGDSKEIYTKSGTQQNPDWETMKNPRGGTFSVDNALTERIAGWKNSPDIWMFGYFQYDWADSTTPLKSFDSGSITTEYASVYGFKEGADYYFFNVFEELDAENEWYIDRENLTLYWIPPADFEQKSIQLSLETKDLITLDGAQSITFDGITLTGTRACALKGTGSNITVRGCTVRNIGETAIELEGTQLKIEGNHITGTGKAGIVLTGGDRNTLTSSENAVTNNLIHDWSQIYQTYQAAVALHGAGSVCSQNEIFNSPHEAITYSGNNHTIEYNVIHDVVLKSSDAGAIYAGRSWSGYGNTIRYNCIYNIGSDGFSPNGIYFDDALSGQSAYGNLLVNIPGCGFLIGGGRDMNITNNMIVNAATPISYDDRAIAGIEDNGWFTHANTPESTLWKSLEEVDVHSQPWKDAYPQLSLLTSDFSDTSAPSFAANPAGSAVQNNVIIGSRKWIGDIAKRVKKYSSVSENRLYKGTDGLFTGEGTYMLKTPGESFKPLPLEDMGRAWYW